MKTIEDAYKYVIDIIIFDLISSGFTVKLKRSKSSYDTKFIKKYNNDKTIDPCFWIHASFLIKNESQFEIIFKKQKELLDLGISFDTGYGGGERDWELDWSFKYKKEENTEKGKERNEQ